MTLSSRHIEYLLVGFQQVLPANPSDGDMAFLRCLDPTRIVALCASPKFSLPGWTVRGVGAVNDPARRLITADQAVALREDKRDAVLLLIDTEAVHTGLDGIYSAVAEISERRLFEKANQAARNDLQRPLRKMAETALARASRIGSRQTVSPWLQFDFLVECVERPDAIGEVITKLGFWPIEDRGNFNQEDLDKSARLVEKLLLETGGANAPSTRIDALQLQDATEEQRRALERFVRRAGGMRWIEALQEIKATPSLWLNAIKPGIFDATEVSAIELVPWTNPKGKPLAWSGLSLDEDDALQIVFDPEIAGTKDQAKLEVRWKPIPENLPKGAVEFLVSVIAGDELLTEKTVAHTGKDTLRRQFTIEDFDLERIDSGKFEARVVVEVLGKEEISVETDDFLLCFGKAEIKEKTSGGKSVRTLVEGAAVCESREAFLDICRTPDRFVSEDKKGGLLLRAGRKSFRVSRPLLLKRIDEDWFSRQGRIGRWEVRVRIDGTPIGPPRFHPIVPDDDSSDAWKRLVAASRAMCEWMGPGGRLGVILDVENKSAEEYLRAWAAALDTNLEVLCLAGTIDVRHQSGQPIGLIVTPIHPVRFAWHLAYDTLAQHLRYEENLTPAKLTESLAKLDAAYFPLFLPGLEPAKPFVFADTLGPHAAAFLTEAVDEPKAAIALLARALADEADEVAPSVGEATTGSLGREIRKYIDLHRDYRLIHVNTLRAGDGKTISRALGLSIRHQEDDSEEPGERSATGFHLNLFSTSHSRGISGQFLLDAVSRRRTGAGTPESPDRWMGKTVKMNGTSFIPSLKWARKDEPFPTRASHVSVAFDTFSARITPHPDAGLQNSAQIEGFGLIAPLRRRFGFEPEPTWLSYLPMRLEGEKHPLKPVLSDRLIKLHEAVLRQVVYHVGGTSQDWPVLTTTLHPEQADQIERLHHLSDWVITIDRNAGAEYFDSPRDRPEIFKAYIIDCTPERRDLANFQLVTSTCHLAEIRSLLAKPLSEMGLSSSEANCTALLDGLKSLSGRLAMRLASYSELNGAGEFVALAMVYNQCSEPELNGFGLSLAEGFFIPLDDVPDLFVRHEPDTDLNNLRADLLYVTASKRGGLQFRFIEVKFRRYLRMARTELDHIEDQLMTAKKRFEARFSNKSLSSVEVAINGSILVRILRFYADKARRHTLNDDAWQRLNREFDRVLSDGRKFQPKYAEDLGFIFCPEYTSTQSESLRSRDDVEIFLFGPHLLPDRTVLPVIEPSATGALIERSYAPTSIPTGSRGVPVLPDATIPVAVPPQSPIHVEEQDSASLDAADPSAQNKAISELMAFVDNAGASEPTAGSAEMAAPPAREVLEIGLGVSSATEKPVTWSLSVRANPHLLILGQSGTGKTTSLINITRQLHENGVTPVIFSYHDDIDDKLMEIFGESEIRFVDCDNLGFNPLRVIGTERTSYLDNAGMIRDIFTSIFTDLGDVQADQIRTAIKNAYEEIGWGKTDATALDPPRFQRFFDILEKSKGTNPNLLARLREMNDYGFFQGTDGRRSILDETKLCIIRIHKRQNEVLQRAFAAFVLQNIYQEMFLRGIQPKLTHAVAFDEAHRASRLALLSTMAKECRKYGLSLIVSSQEAKDFQESLLSQMASCLSLRLIENDAKAIARHYVPDTQRMREFTDRIKGLPNHHGLFFKQNVRQPISVALSKLESLP